MGSYASVLWQVLNSWCNFIVPGLSQWVDPVSVMALFRLMLDSILVLIPEFRLEVYWFFSLRIWLSSPPPNSLIQTQWLHRESPLVVSRGAAKWSFLHWIHFASLFVANRLFSRPCCRSTVLAIYNVGRAEWEYWHSFQYYLNFFV